MVAVATIGSGLLSAGASIFGSSEAASAQRDAANEANARQKAMFDQTQANLQPFISGGTSAFNTLNAQLPSLTAPISMGVDQVRQTPGYQFNLSQGLESVQNSAAARGLGVSGAAMKGAANFATGLADSTYQNQFNNALANRNMAYNMLSGASGIGENAAAGLGNNATATGSIMGQNTIGAGNATAASYMTGANALSNAANTIPQAYLLNNYLSNQNNNAAMTNPFGGYNATGL